MNERLSESSIQPSTVYQNANSCLGRLVPDIVKMIREEEDELRIEQEARELISGLQQAVNTGQITTEQIPEFVSELAIDDPYMAFLVHWSFFFPQPDPKSPNK